MAIFITGGVLSALDLPYLLGACDGGSCNAALDVPMGLFVVMKALLAAGVLGWISAATYGVRGAFVVGSIAVGVEAMASGGLLYIRFITGTPNPSDLASIPVDVVILIVVALYISVGLGGLPAIALAALRTRLTSRND